MDDLPYRGLQFSVGSKLSWDCSAHDLFPSGLYEQTSSLSSLQPLKATLPERRMVLWPQLALCLNHQIEIISVTWVCGTPA